MQTHRKAAAAFGLALACGGVAVVYWLQRVEHLAGPLSSVQAQSGPRACEAPIQDVLVNRYVLAESDSESLAVILQRQPVNPDRLSVNPDRLYLSSSNPELNRKLQEQRSKEDADCVVEVSLSAPGFEYEPKENPRKMKLPRDGSSVKAIWVLAPRKVGNHVVAITAGDSTREFSFQVVSVLGLSSKQLAIASYLCAFLGSALTLPWLLERLRSSSRSPAQPRRPSASEQ